VNSHALWTSSLLQMWKGLLISSSITAEVKIVNFIGAREKPRLGSHVVTVDIPLPVIPHHSNVFHISAFLASSGRRSIPSF